MREIKFRGLTVNGEWVFGSLVNAQAHIKHKPKSHTKTWIVTSAFGNGGWFNVKGRKYVKPETVGQLTGLKDESGVDIYEGDVVECWTLSPLGDIEQSCTMVASFEYSSFLALTASDNQLVIGNIHQNPEP